MVDLPSTNSSDSRGVVPVVGIVLMIALTVTLASVFGAFLFDMTEALEDTPRVGVTSTDDGDEATIRIIGVPHADNVYARYNKTYYGVNGTSSDTPSDLPEAEAGETIKIDISNGGGDTIFVLGELDGDVTVVKTHRVR